MNQTARTASSALAAALLLAAPCAASAQTTTMTGDQQTTMLRTSMSRMDDETRALAGLKNQVPSRNVIPVSLDSMGAGAGSRMRVTAARHDALIAAMAKVTVADVDRNNGQSPDQNSLEEYLQHLGIAPDKVVAVDVDTKTDPENPRVTVFYRGKPTTTTQGG